MVHSHYDAAVRCRTAWNEEKTVGAKRPLPRCPQPASLLATPILPSVLFHVNGRFPAADKRRRMTDLTVVC